MLQDYEHTPSRREYECSKCNRPVKGHKRGPDRKLICNIAVPQSCPSDESSLASPPPSPPRSPPPPRRRNHKTTHEVDFAEASKRQTHLRRSPSPGNNSSTPSYELPAIGPWDRKRLARWTAPPRLEEMRHSSPQIPTLLADSLGNTIREGSQAEVAAAVWEEILASQKREGEQSGHGTIQANRDNQQPQGVHTGIINDINGDTEGITNRYMNTSVNRVLRSVADEPLFIAIRVRAEDMPRLEETAARQGLYTSILRTPPSSPSTPYKTDNNLFTDGAATREGSWIVVIGQTPELTQLFVDTVQRVMPGTIAPDKDLMAAPKIITMPQLILCVFLGVLLAVAILLTFI